MRLFMLYLDLDELPALFDGYRLASARGRSLAEFRRADHLGDPRRPLADEVRALVAARSGTAPAGPIRLLTNLRYLGHAFNPVCFYYCFDAAGERVEAVVAEVTNTPWGECHAYVLEPDPARSRPGVDHARDASRRSSMSRRSWVWTTPTSGGSPIRGEQLIVHIDSHARRAARVRRDALAGAARADAGLARAPARPPPAADAADPRADLRPRRARVGQGRVLLPQPERRTAVRAGEAQARPRLARGRGSRRGGAPAIRAAATLTRVAGRCPGGAGPRSRRVSRRTMRRVVKGT